MSSLKLRIGASVKGWEGVEVMTTTQPIPPTIVMRVSTRSATRHGQHLGKKDSLTPGVVSVTSLGTEALLAVVLGRSHSFDPETLGQA